MEEKKSQILRKEIVERFRDLGKNVKVKLVLGLKHLSILFANGLCVENKTLFLREQL